jgi:hypothetical protein
MHFGKIKNTIYSNLFACAPEGRLRGQMIGVALFDLWESLSDFVSEDLAYQTN